MDNKRKNELKKYLNQKKIIKYNELLKDEIINVTTYKIKLKNPSYEFSSFLDLLNYSNKFLSSNEARLIRAFYDTVKSDDEEYIKSDEYMEVYNKLSNL